MDVAPLTLTSSSALSRDIWRDRNGRKVADEGSSLMRDVAGGLLC
uniref:Uncharacterized protein n=1 Tax=Picea glauca TaxID=3330 RepID=A0A117NHL0_PICGL|nr:hypothetical protein ABT39_MTgene4561 [Picea glauca]QHR87132.1 hypothetical protein Q903MT_gene1141 [Picea sitchensis]